MIIIVESGSTKTDWIVLDRGEKVLVASTAGFNPNYFPASALDENTYEIASNIAASRVAKVFFYGSGCTREGSKTIVTGVLQKYFPNAKREVRNDLFGAARALFGAGSGIASILGTGSSSCLFIDGEIAGNVPSLGYLLADEGSGFHLGKLLVGSFFRNQMPEHLRQRFSNETNLDLSGFISSIYSDPKPNSTLASFVPFIVANKKDPFLANLIKKAFHEFLMENIVQYPKHEEYNLGFVGSVAFLFQDELEETAHNLGLKVSKVIKNPIDDLVKFHLTSA
jgi:N-acetylglucosamine kinase-like BadF-type ATPase